MRQMLTAELAGILGDDPRTWVVDGKIRRPVPVVSAR